MEINSTCITKFIKAPREKVYQALISAEAIPQWKVPTGMSLHIHQFEGREGGTLRISLTYEAPDRSGKTSAHTDTYHGHFAELVPNEKVVEIDEFETSDPSLQGKMTITITLFDKENGTELQAVHDHLPPGVSLKDNEEGWRLSLNKLAALLERR